MDVVDGDPVEVPATVPVKRRSGRPFGSKNRVSRKSFLFGDILTPPRSKGKGRRLSVEISAGSLKHRPRPLASSTPNHERRQGRPPGAKDKVKRRSKKSFSTVEPSEEAEGTNENGANSQQQSGKRGRKRKTGSLLDERGDDEELEEETSWDFDESSESVFLVADKILHNQLDFLVNVAGASSNLREVVQQIWLSYLTVALPDVSRGVEEAILEDKAWLNSLRQQDFCSLLECKPRDLNTILRMWKHQSSTRAEHHEDEDETTEKNKTDKKNDEKNKNGKKNKDEKINFFRKRKKEFDVQREKGSLVKANPMYKVAERLTITRIASLIALGLHVCEERILFSDVIRWIRVLHFPFLNLNFNVTKKLDASEVATANLLFSVSRLTSYHEIEFHISSVARLLHLSPDCLPSYNVLPVVERFVEELNLPRSLIPFVFAFLEKINSKEYALHLKGTGGASYSRKRASNVEALAMAAVVYSLRLLFGLDGRTEGAIGKEVAGLRELLEEPALFDFDEWRQYILYRRLVLFRHCQTFPSASVPAALSVIATHLERSDPSLSPHSAKFRSESQSAAYGNLQRSFQRPEEKWAESQRSFQEAESVTLAPCLRPFRAHSEALGSDYPLLLREFDDLSLSHLFASTTSTLPKEWRLRDGEMEDVVLGHLGRIRAAQSAAVTDAYPLRSFNVRNHMVGPSLNYLPSEALRFVVEVAAEMIEQGPASLLGEVMYLEMGLFPGNPDCKQTGGKGFDGISKLRNGR